MKVLITGIGGFLGKRLAKYLVSKGIEVVGVAKEDVKDLKCKVFKCNILDIKKIESELLDCDVFVHLAAITIHDEIVKNEEKTTEINLKGTRAVLDIFNKSDKSKIFIYSSTGKVYGKIAKLPIQEDHKPSPLNALGRSKLATEDLISQNIAKNKSYIILRVFNVYGENQKAHFLIPTIIDQIKNSQTITLGDIDSKRDFIYIDDVLSAIEKIINKKNTKHGLQKYNVCSGKAVSPSEIVKIIEGLTNRPIEIKVDKKRFRNDEENIEYGSFNKASEELTWVPQTDLKEGLRRILLANNLI